MGIISVAGKGMRIDPDGFTKDPCMQWKGDQHEDERSSHAMILERSSKFTSLFRIEIDGMVGPKMVFFSVRFLREDPTQLHQRLPIDLW